MFKQPCFVRKNTKKLVEELEKLGYDYAENGAGVWFMPLASLSFLGVNLYSEGYYMGVNGSWSDTWYDCGTNEKLFLALAALRGDTDYMQYFVCADEFVLCDRNDWVDMYSVLHSGGKYSIEQLDNAHKATAEELIEHFK